MELIPKIIPILFIAFLVIGVMWGFFRGFKRTLIKLIWTIVVVVISAICAKHLLPKLLNINVAGLGLTINGSQTLGEYIANLLASNLASSGVVLTAEQISGAMSFLAVLITMLLSGIAFIIFYFVFRFLLAPLFWIARGIFAKRYDKIQGEKIARPKHRLFGALMGVVIGIFTFSVVTLPFTGYLNIVDKIEVATKDDSGKGVICKNEVVGSIVYDAYLNNGIIATMDKIGIKFLQQKVFDSISTGKFNDKTIKATLSTETEAILKVVADVTEISKTVQETGQISENDRTKLATTIDDINSSQIFYALRTCGILQSLTPVIEDSIGGATQGFDVSLVLEDMVTFIATTDNETFKQGLTSIVDLALTIAGSIGDGSNGQELNINALESLGESLDGVIENNVVKLSSVKTLLTGLIDSYITDDTGIVSGAVSDIKSSIMAADNLSFKSELKAIGGLIEGCSPLFSGSSSDLDKDTLIAVGSALDSAVSSGSTLITTSLVNSLVADVISTVDLGDMGSFDGVIGKVQEKLENNEVTAYLPEMKAIGEILSVAELFSGSDFLSNLSLVGQSFDNVIGYNSVIFTENFIDDILVSTIETTFEEDGGVDNVYKNTLDKIVLPFKEHSIITNDTATSSYEKEFTAISKVLEVKDSIGDEITSTSLENIGKKVDEAVSLNSKTITRSLVNGLITDSFENIVNDSFETGSFNNAVTSIKSGFNSFNEGSYALEMKALGVVVENKNSISGSIDGKDSAKKIGEILDVVNDTGAKIINYKIINTLIVDTIDTYITTEIGDSYYTSVQSIKNAFKLEGDNAIGYKTKANAYANEFTAIGMLLEIKEDNESSFNKDKLVEVGGKLDSIVALNGKAITYVVIDNLVYNLIEESFDTTDTKYAQIINDVKLAFGENHPIHTDANKSTYVNEFTAVSKLLALQEDSATINKDNIVSFGEKLDEVTSIANVKCITSLSINKMIISVIDGEFTGDNAYTDSLNEIKKPFDISSGVEQVGKGEYAKEFSAISILLDVKEDNESSFNKDKLVEVGGKLDTVVALNTKSINYIVIDNLVYKLIEESFKEGGAIESEYQNTVNKLVLPFKEHKIITGDASTSSYEKEFTAISKMMDVKEDISEETSASSLEGIGVKFDDVLSLNAKTVDRELINGLINESFEKIIDDDSSSANFDSAIDLIKSGFTNFNSGSYATEMKALGKVYENKSKINGSVTDKESSKEIGVIIDSVNDCGAKVVNYKVLNTLINDTLDSYITTTEDDSYYESVNKIKTAFAIENESAIGYNINAKAYEVEFTAIGLLLEIKNENESKFTASSATSAGVKLDSIISLNAKSINYEVIDSLVHNLVDDSFDISDTKYLTIIEDVKFAFGSTHPIHLDYNKSSYTNEFTAIGKLIELEEEAYSLNNDKMVEFGQKIDEITLIENIKCVKPSSINKMIATVIDDKFKGNETYLDCLMEIEKPFNISSGAVQVGKGEYTKEFTALSKLVDFKDTHNKVSKENAKDVGSAFDEIITINSKSITNIVLNILLDDIISSSLEVEDANFDNEVKTQLACFESKNVTVYTKEFDAIYYVLAAEEVLAEGFNTENAGTIGKDIDLALSQGALVLNKGVVDTYFIKVIDSDTINISSSSTKFSNSKQTIKNNLQYIRNDNYMVGDEFKYTYESELKYIDSLVSISNTNEFENYTIGEPTTIGSSLDAIAPSVLVGGCGIEAIQSYFSSYKNKPENDKYISITSVLESNLNGLNVNCGLNYGATGYDVTYANIIDAFNGVYNSLSGSTEEDKITGKEEFKEEVAEFYENKLCELEENIIVRPNGARAVAYYVLDEVKALLYAKVDETSFNSIIKDAVKDEIDTLITNYETYYSREVDTSVRDYYTTTEPNKYYNVVTNEFVATEDGNTIKVNKPFTSILEEYHDIILSLIP